MLCFLLVFKSKGQLVAQITKDAKSIYAKVELRSAYQEADSAWVRSVEERISRSMRYDNGAKEGKYIVSVRFVVSKDGSISDIACDKDPGFGMCQEVMNAIKRSRNFLPRSSKQQVVSDTAHKQ
ncbi:energy transducer TonB [Ferruginibacter sp.]